MRIFKMEEELTKENRSSITLKKNAKGEYAWDIKVYFDEEQDYALDKLKDIDEKLKKTYLGD